MVHSVSRFEANLLSILYAVLGYRGGGPWMSKILQPMPQPKCLSRDTVRLVEQALAKGMSLWLASADGWRVERFLRNEKPVSGRLWERTSPSDLGLAFSRKSLEFLVWLTAKQPLLPENRWQAPLGALTVGDQLLILRTLSALTATPVATRWFAEPVFTKQPLIALFFLDSIADERSELKIDFTPWMHGAGAIVLECLQSELAERWVRIERAKRQIQRPEQMVRLGKLQQQVLGALTDAAEQSGRRDLCRFLLMALAELTTEEGSAREWVRSLKVDHLRLADRTTFYQTASAFLGFAKQLRRWIEACAATGYFDEGYQAAQLWLADWERYDGDGVSRRALAMVKNMSF